MPYRVLIGLPSYCEADTISTVTADVDKAAATLPFSADVTLVNADNASPDGTSEAFLATPTVHPKHVLTTKRPGKGINSHALMRFQVDHRFDAMLTVDTDLAEVPAEWVHAMLAGVRDGADFCYPSRPPRWNGADLTYHLAYPVLAAAFGADLREPLSGDLAVSSSGAKLALDMPWTDDDLRFGGDFRLAALASTRSWRTVTLSTKRRNKLRSFTASDDGYRMGAKFAENAAAVRRSVAERINAGPAPAGLQDDPNPPPSTTEHVPLQDHDMDALASSTARNLRAAAGRGSFDQFQTTTANRLRALAASDPNRGLDWPLWRDCLVAWLRDPSIATDTLEDLFLGRVVGHHREIAGSADWYGTVVEQAMDLFTRRHLLWAAP